jgi:hypothetical protein
MHPGDWGSSSYCSSAEITAGLFNLSNPVELGYLLASETTEILGKVPAMLIRLLCHRNIVAETRAK